jgi:glycosyltransferase involved in cell wall biosynthesis
MHVAGAEVLVAEIVRRLVGRIDPTVFCLDAIGALGELLRSEGVEVTCLGRRPGRDWRVAWHMARHIRRRKVDVLHAHQYTPFFYAAFARVLAGGGPRLILTEHGRHYPDVVRPLRRAINRLALDKMADAVNACCNFSARALCRVDGFAGRRIAVIENGIDPDRYGRPPDGSALRTRLGLDPARRYVVCVARFHPVKDHATLLHAFAAVAAARSDVDLLLAGDGQLRPDLERLAAAAGIGPRVRFLGVRSDVPQLLKACDVFALASVSEAASLTLMEAMAAGLPVVVTDVGGNPEVVRDGHEGRLVPRGDAGAMAAALLGVLDDPVGAASMGDAGCRRVEEHYRLAVTVERYYQLYCGIVGKWLSA